MTRYFKCCKCGSITKSMNAPEAKQYYPKFVCVADMAGRTSGICGGSFEIEIHEQEYIDQLIEWRNK